jgi:hypothetical protein
MDSGSVAPHLDGGLYIALWICNWSIGEVGMFAIFVDSVDSEAIDAFVQPEPDGAVVDRLTRSFVVPVEIWLLPCIEM